MAKSGIFQSFFVHDFTIFQYFAKQIFAWSSVVKDYIFDLFM